ASDGSGNQMEIGFDTSKVMVTYDFGGEYGEITDSLQNWANWANNATIESIDSKLGKFSDYSYNTRCQITAGIERALLNWFTTTPLYYRNVASLKSQKVEWAVDQYLNIIGFGGIEFYTYNYDDAEWADYIANNTLVY
ncbi:MAG: hypothetical protein II920_06525, partial [Clostridia bacterium]|nr:hypothetical protein [Clostridia bacterium]